MRSAGHPVLEAGPSCSAELGPLHWLRVATAFWDPGDSWFFEDLRSVLAMKIAHVVDHLVSSCFLYFLRTRCGATPKFIHLFTPSFAHAFIHSFSPTFPTSIHSFVIFLRRKPTTLHGQDKHRGSGNQVDTCFISGTFWIQNIYCKQNVFLAQKLDVNKFQHESLKIAQGSWTWLDAGRVDSPPRHHEIASNEPAYFLPNHPVGGCNPRVIFCSDIPPSPCTGSVAPVLWWILVVNLRAKRKHDVHERNTARHAGVARLFRQTACQRSTCDDVNKPSQTRDIHDMCQPNIDLPIRCLGGRDASPTHAGFRRLRCLFHDKTCLRVDLLARLLFNSPVRVNANWRRLTHGKQPRTKHLTGSGKIWHTLPASYSIKDCALQSKKTNGLCHQNVAEQTGQVDHPNVALVALVYEKVCCQRFGSGWWGDARQQL